MRQISRRAVILAALFARVVPAPIAPPLVFEAISQGRPLNENERILDVAMPSMLYGADCSAAHPCWVVAQEAVNVVAEDGTTLKSVSSRDVVSCYARGKAVSYRKTRHLILEPLLDVMWAIDPDSFFYA